MPAPEENVAETSTSTCMRRNADLYGMAFCLGPEDAVYLVGGCPAAWWTTRSSTGSRARRSLRRRALPDGHDPRVSRALPPPPPASVTGPDGACGDRPALAFGAMAVEAPGRRGRTHGGGPGRRACIRAGWASRRRWRSSSPSGPPRRRSPPRHPGLVVHRAGRAATRSAADGGAVLAVKPDVAEAACAPSATAGARPGALGRGRPVHRPARGCAAGRDASSCGPMPNTPVAGRAPGWRRSRAGATSDADDLDWAEGVLSAVGHRGAAARAPPRRGHRPVGLGPGVRLPGRRGADRGRRARRAWPAT